MTLLIDRTHGTLNTVLKFVRDLCTLAILVILLMGSWKNFGTAVRGTRALRISWKWFCFPMLIASAGMILLHLRNMFLTYVKHQDVSGGGGADPCS